MSNDSPGSIANPSRQRDRSSAFSLVELLVAVGVIAVLVIIGAGSMARSRVSARALQSISQLRAIGVALDQYRFDHQGFYPAISSEVTLGNGAKEITTWTRDPLGPYLPLRPGRLANLTFVCPNARYEGFPDNTQLTRTFAASAAMVGLNATGTSTTDQYKPRHISSIGRLAETPLVVDAKQASNSAWSAAFFYQSQVMSDLQLQHPSETKNIDFRHNGVAHFLYCDGHIESLRLHEARARITAKAWMGIW